MLSKFVNLQYTSLQQASRRIEFGQNYRQLQVLALAAQMIYVQFRGGPSLYKQPPSAFAENGIARKTIDSEDNQGWGGEEGGAQ